MFKVLTKKLHKKDRIITIIAFTVGIFASLSFIEIIISNLKEDSNIYIQPLVVVFNAIFWSLHAISRKDIPLLITNFLGISLGLAAAISAFI
jgi:hypothetical protein